MKSLTNILISHVVFLALFAVAAIALAQTDTDDIGTSTLLRDRVETRQAELQQKREDVQQRISDQKTALTDRVQERVTNLAANISNRMDAAIVRLAQITGRIESRSQKLADQGVDTSAADAAVANARASLSEATVIMSNIDAIVAESVTSENPQGTWPTVRETFTAAATELRAAREHLRLAVTALKTAVAAANSTSASDAVRNDASDGRHTASSSDETTDTEEITNDNQ